MDNALIAKFFWDIASLLELQGENPFRIRSYQKAAQAIEDHPENIRELYLEKGIESLEEIPGIGESISHKIAEIVKDGKPEILKELFKKTPPGLLDILKIQGVGPKLTKLVHDELGIKTVAQLEKAAKSGALLGLPGIEHKKIENILKGIEQQKNVTSKFHIGEVAPMAESIADKLRSSKTAGEVLICGSLRRAKDTIGDIDILATSKDPEKVMDLFTSLPGVKDVVAKGETKSSVVLDNNLNADLRVVNPQNFGAAAHYFTGSKQHNIKMRALAAKKGLKLSEYGLFKGKKNLACKTEEDIFKALGLQFIPPEIREDTGEIELAAKKNLPRLIELKDILGDLHAHSTYSDGKNTIEEMALAARALGYEYIAITDHSRSTRIAGGLSPKELEKQMDEIDRLNKKLKGIRVLKGSEVDIMPDGTLDFDDGLLKRLDIVLASIHSRFGMGEAEMTKRIISAVENKYVTAISHPTGRLLSRRDPYAVNIEKVIEAASKTGTCLELNCFPDRLDLNDTNCRLAKQKGVMISLGTDSHSLAQLSNISYGIGTARRGWLEKKDVLNCLGLQKLLSRKK